MTYTDRRTFLRHAMLDPAAVESSEWILRADATATRMIVGGEAARRAPSTPPAKKEVSFKC